MKRWIFAAFTLMTWGSLFLTACVLDPIVGNWDAVVVMGQALPASIIGETSGCTYSFDAVQLEITDQFHGMMFRTGTRACEGGDPEELYSPGITLEKWPLKHKTWTTDVPDAEALCGPDSETEWDCSDPESTNWDYDFWLTDYPGSYYFCTLDADTLNCVDMDNLQWKFIRTSS